MPRAAVASTKNLFLRGSIWYMRFRYCGVNVSESTQTTNLEQAKQRVEQKKHEIYDRKIVNPQKYQQITTGRLLSTAIEDIDRQRWSTNRTAAKSRMQAYTFVKLMGDLSISEITTETIRNYKDALRSKKIAESTINRYVSAISAVLHHAAKVESLTLPVFEKTKERKKRITTYTPEELTKFVTWSDQNCPIMSDLIYVLYDTGLRLSEALAIGSPNLTEYRQGSITVWDSKGGETRTILTTKRVDAILSKLSQGFGLTIDQAEYQWGKLRDTLELPSGYVIHCLRHTCATRLLAGGMGLREVQGWMGHKSIMTTERYLHCVPGAKKSAVSILEEV